MRKKRLAFYYIILMLICLVPVPVSAVSETQKDAIVSHCDAIKDTLKNVQKTDARTRLYLGGLYETILTKFIVPLNMRLVENNLSTAKLVENQNNFADTKATFANDYVAYQQMLEELVAMDCKNKPDEFYQELIAVRQRRKTMAQDVLKMRSLLSEHLKLVEGVRGGL